ncbi:electron transporter [Perilla frutescens var. hirtella]|nr:electron transporter [Perilla frutescens var. frutescens]KAH6775172.1 electron transporter [Perilla frutescens var. hirtella]
MDLWRVHAKGNGFLLRNSFSDKPICWSSKNNSINWELRSSKAEFVPGGNSDHLKAGGDGLKGNNPPSGSKKSDDASSQNSQCKPLDWREFRALLYLQEQAENADFVHNQDRSKSLPSKWAHPISAPENGCLLVATEKLDGVRTFERTVVLLLKSGTRNPQEGPFGVVINRPLHKKMKHMNPTNIELGTTFADCSLQFGGPLDASMFLLRAVDTTGLPGFEEVIPGVYFGSRNSLDEASALIKKGKLLPQDFKFFMGYAGWQLEQLREEIESDYWHVAACSANLISWASQNSSSDNLWEEILQLMGGPYSELSRKPKQDI